MVKVMYNLIFIIICEILGNYMFQSMRYLDFSTPKSVMRRIFFEVFISVRGVCARAVGIFKRRHRPVELFIPTYKT